MRPTRALIHQSNLLHNFDRIRRALKPGTAVCAAVKADAYGHGAVATARILVEAGAPMLGVATVEEGLELRAAGLVCPILLFGTFQPDELPAVVEADLDLYLWTPEAIREAARAAVGRRNPLRIHLKVDTGMGRGGCRPDEVEQAAEAIVHSLPLELTGLCTHLASSDGPGPVTVADQLSRFAEAEARLRVRGWYPRYVHAANSGGVLSWPGTHFNLVRPGIALYGYGPAEAELKPVMELVSRVGFVKTVPAGTALSYGSTYVTRQETDVATIPLGYADGYRRAFSNRAELLIAGRRFRVSGTVCMDQFLVDLGPASGIRAGDEVVLFGPARDASETPPTAETLAHLADTISYEILCGVAARVPRVLV